MPVCAADRSLAERREDCASGDVGSTSQAPIRSCANVGHELDDLLAFGIIAEAPVNRLPKAAVTRAGYPALAWSRSSLLNSCLWRSMSSTRSASATPHAADPTAGRTSSEHPRMTRVFTAESRSEQDPLSAMCQWQQCVPQKIAAREMMHVIYINAPPIPK